MLKERAAARGFALQAIHINHGLSPNAHAWAAFCRRLCKRLGVPLTVRRITVRKTGEGLEAAARNARYKAFSKLKTDCIALAHNLDDQAETVLMNLLRGAGLRGASGMAPESRLHGKRLLRPLLDVPRREIERYARRHGLEWIEDESNADESLTRNFIRRRVAASVRAHPVAWARAISAATITRPSLVTRRAQRSTSQSRSRTPRATKRW